jgi:hypothetical protein
VMCAAGRLGATEADVIASKAGVQEGVSVR